VLHNTTDSYTEAFQRESTYPQEPTPRKSSLSTAWETLEYMHCRGPEGLVAQSGYTMSPQFLGAAWGPHGGQGRWAMAQGTMLIEGKM
jgi:hypothetical protein